MSQPTTGPEPEPYPWSTQRPRSSLGTACRSELLRLRRALLPAAARDFEAGALLQDFLVASVVAILLTRAFLGLTGYPRLGGGGLHMAHMLWGGLLMLAAQVLLLAVLGKRTKHLAAWMGGAGFGLFVDELGKFLTADNDYFFRPTIALIYGLLVLLFLTFRAIERRSLSTEESLANAADMLREVILGGATETEVRRALWLLERGHMHGQLADGLREAIAGAVRVAEHEPPLVARAAARAWRVYGGLIAWRWFQRAVLVLFVGQALLGIPAAVLLLVAAVALAVPAVASLVGLPDRSALLQQAVASPPELWVAAALTGSSVASVACTMLGVVRLRRSRLGAYRWLERSVLVSILFAQALQFWQEQLAALGTLAFNLLLLAGLRYGIRHEEARQHLGDPADTRLPTGAGLGMFVPPADATASRGAS